MYFTLILQALVINYVHVRTQFSLAGSDLDLLTPVRDEGFTAVILTYNRVEELFRSIISIAAARSLVKVPSEAIYIAGVHVLYMGIGIAI